jgi:large subunit ribosomal protein L21
MRAVLKTGGKQYRVAVGDVLRVEKRPEPIGSKITLGPLLLLQTEEGITTDPEALKGSSVVCELLHEGREKKVLVFKKKRRKNYRRTQGHRQSFTQIRIVEIAG